MEIAISKIDAAVEQLDWAIKLFLDHRAWIPAITLAGAAEEVLGKLVGQRAAFGQLKTKFTTELGMAEKTVSQDHLNRAKNWLKHCEENAANATIRLDAEEEAIQYIVRALTNLAGFDGSQPSEGTRFWKWMELNRAELMADSA